MADEKNFADLPLVDRLSRAGHLSRELSEHLRQACVPKLTALIRASREYNPQSVSDQQILDLTQAVLEANDFAEDLQTRLRACLISIREEMDSMLFGTESSSSSSFLAMPVFNPDDLQK